MRKTLEITSLEEDLKFLGITPKKAIVEDNNEPVVPVTPVVPVEPVIAPVVPPAVVADPANLEEMRIIKVKKGSAARLAKRKSKLYYKKNRAKLKTHAKRYAKTSGGKKATARRFKVTHRLGADKMAAIHGQGKRISLAASVQDESFEALDKMAEILDLVETKTTPLAESTDTLIAEYVEFVDDYIDQIDSVMEQISNQIEADEFTQEELEEALAELADEVYEMLDAVADLESLSEEDETPVEPVVEPVEPVAPAVE